MKKIVLLLVFLISIASVYAQCSGPASYNVVEGNTINIEANTGSSASNWRITAGDTHNFPPASIFTGATGCSVDFYLPLSGTYTVVADTTAGTSTTTVTVNDILSTVGYGHQCYVIDTSNCGDIYAYGDVQATDFVDASEIFAYGSVYSAGELTIGDYVSPEVFINSTFVSLPETSIVGNLDVLGIIRGISGTVNMEDAAISGGLNVSGATNLYHVERIANPGNTITVIGDIDDLGDLFVQGLLTASNMTVLGLTIVNNDLTTGTLTASGDIIVSGDVAVTGSEDRIIGAVNLRYACDSASPKLLSSGSNLDISLGVPGGCTTGQRCTDDSDCTGTCDTVNHVCN